MNGVLEVREVAQEPVESTEVQDVVEPETEADHELRGLVRRCRLLLTERPTTDRPPGHWLG
jgi:hypothetical protein